MLFCVLGSAEMIEKICQRIEKGLKRFVDSFRFAAYTATCIPLAFSLESSYSECIFIPCRFSLILDERECIYLERQRTTQQFGINWVSGSKVNFKRRHTLRG